MYRRADLRRTAPWVLCAVSLGLLAFGVWDAWRFPDPGLADEGGWEAGLVMAMGVAGISVVGALIAARLPGNPYGWLWCAIGLTFAVGAVQPAVVRVTGSPPWVDWLLGAWDFVIALALLAFVFLLFPTGRVPSSGWRLLSRAVLTVAVLLAVAVTFIADPSDSRVVSPWAPRGGAGRVLGQVAMTGVYVMFGFVLAAMASLALRFRRAGPVERRQLTWFLYATVVNAVLLVLDQGLGVLPVGLVLAVVEAATMALLPIAVGVAIFRYRLFEIDRIVSRTVSYGVLTAGLIGLYLVVVAFLRPLLEPLTGSSTLAVAGSTLAVAAVFNPARRRLQEAVDRRFDRARYDAVRAVDAFAARLRNQVDLDEITAGLRDTVEATVAPGRITVWLRPTDRV